MKCLRADPLNEAVGVINMAKRPLQNHTSVPSRKPSMYILLLTD